MSYYLNYKLKLKSGIVYESDNGGYQGAPRDAFLEDYKNKPKHLTERSQFDECCKNLENVRSFDVLLFGDFPEDVSNYFEMDDHYDGAVDYVGASIYDNNGMQTATGFDVYRNPAIKDKALAFFKTVTL